MKQLQIAISMDVTGSMSSVLSQVRRGVSDLLNNTFSKYKNIQISLTCHGNYCDSVDNQVICMPFTNDIETLVKFVQAPKNIQGGDYQAIYEKVMQVYNGMAWNADALKILCIIGDQIPYGREEYKRYNKQYIDWKDEVEKLKQKRVQIYSIQALSNGNVNSPQYKFYEYIALNTDGIHLQLQQFSQVSDVLEMILLDMVDQATQQDLLGEFKKQKCGRNHGMIRAYQAIKRQPQDQQPEAGQEEEQKVLQAPAARSAQTKKAKSASQVDDSVLQQLVACAPAKYQVIEVDQDCVIDEFVKNNQLEFKVGYGFYEFTVPSIIQNDKLIIALDRVTGQLYEGAQVRQLFGIKDDCKGRQKPPVSSTYAAFIQSTSYTRKLLAGTKFLYVAKDYDQALPEYKPSHVPIDPQQQQKVKDQIELVTQAVKELDVQIGSIHALRDTLVDPNYSAVLQQFLQQVPGLLKF